MNNTLDSSWRGAPGSTRVARVAVGVAPTACARHGEGAMQSAQDYAAPARAARGFSSQRGAQASSDVGGTNRSDLEAPRTGRSRRDADCHTRDAYAPHVAAILIVCLAFLAPCSLLRAAEPAAHTVIVPYDASQPVNAQTPQRYLLDRADFERLWSLAKEHRKPERIAPDPDDAKPASTLHSALYRARIEDERFFIEAQFNVATRGRWATVNLHLNDRDQASTIIVLHDLLLDGQPIAADANDEVRIEHAGQHTISAVYEVPRAQGWTVAALGLPAASASLMLMELQASDATPLFEDNQLLTSESVREGKRAITVALGSATNVKFTRQPRRQFSEAAPPTSTVLTSIEAYDDLRVRSNVWLSFAFPGASRRVLELAVDPAWDIENVHLASEGKARFDTRISFREDQGKRWLRIVTTNDLRDGADMALFLVPHAAALPTRSPVIVPRANRSEGKVMLAAQASMAIKAQPTATQTQLPTYDLELGKQKITAPTYRVVPGEALAFAIEVAAAKTEAHVDYVAQVSEQKLELFAAIELKRARGVWRQLRVTLPEGFEIQSVNGPLVTAWEQTGNEVFLRFANTATTTAGAVIYVAKTLATPTATWTLTPLVLHDIDTIKGSAIVAAHAATEVRFTDFTTQSELRETDPATLKDTFTITPPIEKKRAIEFERAAWSLNVAMKAQAPRFAVDAVALVQATDAGLLVSQQIAVKVEQGAVKSLRVRLPAALPEATVQGALIREVRPRVDGEMREYEITFQSQGGLLDHTELTFDMLLPLTDAELNVPFVEVPGAERLRRWFVLDNASARETCIVQSDGVESSTREALPYAPEKSAQPRYYTGRSAGALKVAFTQLQSTEANAAIITLADITTLLRADGERWDAVVYSLQNRSLQFLPVILPPNAELMAVSVSGEAVRADERAQGASRVRLIPLIQTKPGQTSMDVRMVYRLKGSASTMPSKLTLDDPETPGLSAERTIWTVNVPPGWRIGETMDGMAGNMERVTQEGHAVEKLNKMLSDLGRMNRWMASAEGNASADDNQRVAAQAKQLAQQINVSCSTLMTANGRADYSVVLGTDKQQAFKVQQQVEKDLGQVSQELMRQNELLDNNGQRQSGKDQRPASVLQANDLGNTWAFAKPAFPMTPTTPTAFSGNNLVGYNDNVGVNQGFFTKTGAGTWILSGANTYTGGTTVNGGVVTLGGSVAVTRSAGATVATKAGTTAQVPLLGDVPLAGNLLAGGQSNGTQQAITNNSRAFNTAGNLQLNGGQMQLSPQVVEFNGMVGATNYTSPQAAAVAGVKAGTNTYTGDTTVSAGTLTLTGNVNNLSFGNTTATPDSMDGLLSAPRQGVVDLSAGSSSGQQSGGFDASRATPTPAGAASSTVMGTSGSTLDLSGTSTVAGVVAGSGALAKAGGGTLTVDGGSGSTFAGGITAYAGAPVTITSGIAVGNIAPATPAAAPAPVPEPVKPAEKAKRKDEAQWASQPGAIRVYNSAGTFKSGEALYADGDVATQAVNQLRPTGRRSLDLVLPEGGVSFHFRKLKDHAVLDLALTKEWQPGTQRQLTVFSAGLGAWGLLAFIAARRRRK